MTNIFISHSWRYKDEYETIHRWLKEELNFYDYRVFQNTIIVEKSCLITN